MRCGTLKAITLVLALALPAVAAAEQYGFDSEPPKITADAKKAQKPKGKRVAKIRASCDELCRIAATGDVVIKPAGASKRTELRLKREFENLSADRRWRPTMRLVGKKARRTLEDALADGAKAHADIRLRAEDEIGNPAKAYVTVRLEG